MANNHNSNEIEVQTGLEAVRKRPGMYIGSTGMRGLHHLVYEVIDNSIEEALAGCCTQISVDLNCDGSVAVTDNGRGIPTDINAKTDKSFLETVLTILQACGRCGSNVKVSGGLHGVGIAVVNALCEWLEVTVWQNQQVYTQRYERGNAVTPLNIQPLTESRTGTAITFKPDLEIFKSGIEFDFTTLALRLQEVAYLNPGLKTVLRDLRQSHLATGSQVEIYHYTKGIGEFISEANRDKRSLCQVISAQGEKDGVQIYTAWQWNAFADTDFLRRSFSGNILLKKLIEQEFRTNREYVFDTLHLLSFANQVRTIDGGTHVEGLKAGILKGLNSFARKYQQLPDNSNLQWAQARNGLTAIVAVNLSQPEYGGPMKWKLANPEVTGLVKAMVTEALIAYLDTHHEEGKEIFKLCLAADTRGKTDPF